MMAKYYSSYKQVETGDVVYIPWPVNALPKGGKVDGYRRGVIVKAAEGHCVVQLDGGSEMKIDSLRSLQREAG
jgi:hypothetical protein